MSPAITGYIDVAQIALYAFWIFFFGLIFYLRREDRREGYPLQGPDNDRRRPVKSEFLPGIPSPKRFLLRTGEIIQRPIAPNEPDTPAQPLAPWAGAPLVPTGDPMAGGVGPGAYALRAEVPDQTLDGKNKIAPLRAMPEFSIEARDPDPRGMEVVAADGKVAGTVKDVWVDRAEPMIRYYEVELPGGGRGRAAEGGAAEGEEAGAGAATTVMLPYGFTTVDVRRRRLRVRSITAAQFGNVPRLTSAEQITRREEDRITAYFAAGNLYAMPDRQEPWL